MKGSKPFAAPSSRSASGKQLEGAGGQIRQHDRDARLVEIFHRLGADADPDRAHPMDAGQTRAQRADMMLPAAWV